MTEIRDQIRKLETSAHDLPDGPTKVAIFEEAVQLADSLQDVDLAYRLRDRLMDTASECGQVDVLLVAFAWCLAQYDREPQRFNSYNLFWKYKWIIGAASRVPEISRSRLEALLEDMERRHRAWGSTLYAVWLERRSLRIHLGEREAAKNAHVQFCRRRRDSLSDCLICVADSTCIYYRFQRKWLKAIGAAQPMLDRGLTCTSQPHSLLANMLLPLFHLGRLEVAKEHHKRGYRLVISKPHLVDQHADHLEFVTLTGDLTKAKRMLERHLPSALTVFNLDERFRFLLAARLCTDCLMRQGTQQLKIRLPADLPSPDTNGMSDVGQLGEWFTAQAREIAQRFDARNGTPSFQDAIDGLPELLSLAVN